MSRLYLINSLRCEHNLERTEKVTEQVLVEVYKSLHDHNVYLEGTLLKPSMVISGSNPQKSYEFKIGHDRIANETLRALMRTVPAAVPGILRQTLQTAALKAWVMYGPTEAQTTFRHRARLNALAAKGNYIDDFE
uniref:Fructose-bisphosphate aldolase n=1 Tax=Elaeophora elaphi TaxID=1147741 RepID=A0A0R3RSJ3_9BILA